MIDLIQYVILLAMLITAVLAIKFKDLIASVVALAVFSLLLTIEFFLLHAPDVAIAEAAIGAGLSTAIYIFAVKSTKRHEDAS